VSRLRSFLGTSLLGGLTVLLPIGIFIAVAVWIFRLLDDLVQPVTSVLIRHAKLGDIVAFAATLAIFVLLCFMTGALVKTQIGRFLHLTFEDKILRALPGYRMIRETVLQILGKGMLPFTAVALVCPFGGVFLTAFVVDRHENGWYSVFVPTGPNPTSGNILHVPAEKVTIVDVPIEVAMRSVIACGAGSAPLLTASRQTTGALDAPGSPR
jgi:uncharacterized membrane protein